MQIIQILIKEMTYGINDLIKIIPSIKLGFRVYTRDNFLWSDKIHW